MLKNIFVCFVIVVMLSDVIADEKSEKEVIPMPEGFEGIYLGMPIEELLKIRPKANVHPMDMYSPDQKVDTTKPNQLLQELIEDGPLFALDMLAMYSFRYGKLEDVIIGWTGEDINLIKKHRKNFISSCIKRWGSDYQKKVMKIEPETKLEHLTPVLLWQKGNTIIAVRCTPECEDKDLELGGFMINLFLKDDKEMMDIFNGEEVDKSVSDKLFRGIGISP